MLYTLKRRGAQLAYRAHRPYYQIAEAAQILLGVLQIYDNRPYELYDQHGSHVATLREDPDGGFTWDRTTSGYTGSIG